MYIIIIIIDREVFGEIKASFMIHLFENVYDMVGFPVSFT